MWTWELVCILEITEASEVSQEQPYDKESTCKLTVIRASLEKEMATHSRVLAWRIPWTEKPGRLESMGSHRVGHARSDLAAGLPWWFRQ